MIRRLAAIALLPTLLASGPAHARCEGAMMLGGLHDAYRAMLIEEGAQRLLAARTFLVLAGDGDGRVFAAHLARAGVEADADRLSSVIAGARDLARTVIAGGHPPPGVGRHSAHTDWLGTLYLRTGCEGRRLTPDSRLAAPELDAGREGSVSADVVDRRTAGMALMAGAAILGASGLGILVRRVGKSLPWRRRQVERQPRSPAAFDLEVRALDQGSEAWTSVRALDVSVGGLKLAWEGAPGPGTRLTVRLTIGERPATVMWANAFYAGVMFADFLTEEEIATLLQ